jgi:hypothetical protein
MSSETESARRLTPAAPKGAPGSAAAGPGRPAVRISVVLRDIMAERVTRTDAESKIFGNYVLGMPFQRNNTLIDALIDSHHRAVAALTKLRDLL